MSSRNPEILVVCEGNICRSPLGAVVLADRLALDGIRVTSAGLRAVVGSGMDEMAATQAERFGLDPSNHVARRLTEGMINEASVVLTMTVEQRTRVVQLSPLAMRRTFTMKEFASIADEASEQLAAGSSALQVLAKWGNSTRASHKDLNLDIEDPYRRDEAVHMRVADEIYNASEAIARRIVS